MRAYGHDRRDKLQCKYGCCAGKSAPDRSCRYVVDKAKRKRARQLAKRIICVNNAE